MLARSQDWVSKFCICVASAKLPEGPILVHKCIYYTHDLLYYNSHLLLAHTNPDLNRVLTDFVGQAQNIASAALTDKVFQLLNILVRMHPIVFTMRAVCPQLAVHCDTSACLHLLELLHL